MNKLNDKDTEEEEDLADAPFYQPGDGGRTLLGIFKVFFVIGIVVTGILLTVFWLAFLIWPSLLDEHRCQDCDPKLQELRCPHCDHQLQEQKEVLERSAK